MKVNLLLIMFNEEGSRHFVILDLFDLEKINHSRK